MGLFLSAADLDFSARARLLLPANVLFFRARWEKVLKA
jgi:hypothetical protein